MIQTLETTYPWPLADDPKSVRHFHRHNALQVAAREALSAALCEEYFKFAHFDTTKGSSFPITPAAFAALIAVEVHKRILGAMNAPEDPALLENEAREIQILKAVRQCLAAPATAGS